LGSLSVRCNGLDISAAVEAVTDGYRVREGLPRMIVPMRFCHVARRRAAGDLARPPHTADPYSSSNQPMNQRKSN
jgi:hypothetical protein